MRGLTAVEPEPLSGVMLADDGEVRVVALPAKALALLC